VMATGNASIYCPICGRVIYASNEREVWTGEHGGYLFIHDEVPHTNEDMEALEGGIQ